MTFFLSSQSTQAFPKVSWPETRWKLALHPSGEIKRLQKLARELSAQRGTAWLRLWSEVFHQVGPLSESEKGGSRELWRLTCGTWSLIRCHLWILLHVSGWLSISLLPISSLLRSCLGLSLGSGPLLAILSHICKVKINISNYDLRTNLFSWWLQRPGRPLIIAFWQDLESNHIRGRT